MKKIIVILAMSAVTLSACEGDPEIVPRTPTETKIQELMVGYDGKIDMAAFVADAQQGVWMIDEYDMIYTNGEVLNGRELVGGAFLDDMMLFPNGICRMFRKSIPNPTVYLESQWSVSDQSKNTLSLYSPRIEAEAKTANFDQYAARTTLELLYYKDGVFVMKGLQPFGSWGGKTSNGVYKDYCRVVGHIATDKATVDKYLSYISYEQYKEENPDKF